MPVHVTAISGAAGAGGRRRSLLGEMLMLGGMLMPTETVEVLLASQTNSLPIHWLIAGWQWASK